MNALILSAVLAANPITLDQVRQESRNNLQALLAELDRVRASEQKRFSTGALMPQIQLQAQAGRTIQQEYRDIGTVVAPGSTVNNLQYRQAVTDFPAYAANRCHGGWSSPSWWRRNTSWAAVTGRPLVSAATGSDGIRLKIRNPSASSMTNDARLAASFRAMYQSSLTPLPFPP